jgi:peptidoglycan/xylan/chitin deacetylase (PgdA/CDA1 family)
LVGTLIIVDWRITVSLWSYVFFILCYLTIHAYGVTQVSAQFFTPIKCLGDKNTKSVAITFDDGPLPVMTEKILTILKAHNAQAAFFCIGNRVESYPAIVKKIHEAGHIIGNHTFLHGKFFDLQSAKSMQEELQHTDHVLENVIGKKPRFFRPPYGVTNPNLARAIKKGGYITMGWSVRSLDTVSKDETILFNRVTKNLQGGDVILFHDYCEITIRILPKVLDHIKKLGLKVVRLDELMNEKAYV